MSPAVKKDKVKAGKREESIEMAQSGKVKMVDFKFIDLPGMWQHVSIPANQLKNQFEEGHGFDASSIRGFAHIHESDMLLMPDAETAVIADP